MRTRWIDDWISLRAESTNTRRNYRRLIRLFANFSADRCSKDFYSVVSDWRQAKEYGNMEREQFVEDWEDVVRSFHAQIKERYASLTVATLLTVVKSFFGFWNIPVKVDLPKRACVTYHNKDLTKDDIKQILAHASPRDRVMWLILLESGMRASSLINMKYWQIQDDFEKHRVPMRIVFPSASLKDHVGDRWTFIGQEGYRELKQYLRRRLPLDSEDYVFASEKRKLVKGEQFSISSLSTKFGKLIKQLGLDKREDGKPRRYRQHGLRKYFRNNMKAAINFREFWMGHSIGSDEHYISRDIEVHRAEYSKNYPSLRIYESPKEELRSKDDIIVKLTERTAELEKKNLELTQKLNSHMLSNDQVQELLRRIEKLEKLAAPTRTLLKTLNTTPETSSELRAFTKQMKDNVMEFVRLASETKKAEKKQQD